MHSSRILFCLMALFMITAGPGVTTAAPVVVLSSTEAAYPAGTVTEDATVVEIPAGGVIILNDSTGKTRTLAGPYSGPIGGEAQAAGQSGIAEGLGKLFAARKEERSRLGAIRAAPDQMSRSHERILVTQSAVQCASAAERPILWRPETMNADSRIVISDPKGGNSAEMLWHRGEQEITWPDGLPIVDQGRYLISLDVAPRPVELTLRLVPDALSQSTARAAWMGDAGCRRQALLLLDTIIE